MFSTEGTNEFEPCQTKATKLRKIKTPCGCAKWCINYSKLMDTLAVDVLAASCSCTYMKYMACK
jgi:hypothetical protein